jgi:hypothetical protein
VHALARSGGSRGTGTPVPVDLAFQREQATNLCLHFQARGGLGWPKGHWVVPGGGAIILVLTHAGFGRLPSAWFSQLDPRAPTMPAQYRWSARLVCAISRIEVRIYPAAQLGRMNETWSGLKIGSIEISGGTPLGTLADLVPALSVFDAPYMFRSLAHFHQVARGEIGQTLARRLVEQGGVRVLYHQYFGVRHLTTRNTPVRTPEDVKGLKLRAVPTPILMATLEGLGGRPSPLDFSELYQSLRAGVVDGQDSCCRPSSSRRWSRSGSTRSTSGS